MSAGPTESEPQIRLTDEGKVNLVNLLCRGGSSGPRSSPPFPLPLPENLMPRTSWPNLPSLCRIHCDHGDSLAPPMALLCPWPGTPTRLHLVHATVRGSQISRPRNDH